MWRWQSVTLAVFLLLCVFLALAGCAGVSDSPIVYSSITDQAGNRYPAVCLDVSDVDVVTVPLDHKAMQDRLDVALPGVSLRGQWVGPLDGHGDGTIFIDSSLPLWLFADAVLHEKCHAKMFKLYGDARWHP